MWNNLPESLVMIDSFNELKDRFAHYIYVVETLYNYLCCILCTEVYTVTIIIIVLALAITLTDLSSPRSSLPSL